MENIETIETERLTMRRLMPSDYKAMTAWDMDERVYKYLLGTACKSPEDPEKLGMTYDHSSSYTKSDGSATFASDIFHMTVDK